MASYETKLKLGRKREGVPTDEASANQVSALFRVTPDGRDAHVSLSLESDDMTPDDVAAVFKLLDERGVLRAADCKTWLNQPQASQDKFGKTASWQDQDLGAMLTLMARGLSIRERPRAAVPQAALRRLGAVERAVADLKTELAGGGVSESDEEDADDQ